MNNINPNTNGYYYDTADNPTQYRDNVMFDYVLMADEADPYDEKQLARQYAQQLELLLPTKHYASPLLVLGLMLFCFPIGLFVMLCFTKWGTFPKILITAFVLGIAVAVYEILVAKNILLLPSLLELIKNLFTA